VTAPNRPYSPQTLAQRWGCSAEKIRRMYRNGELAGFELGKLIRIPAAEVERFECQNTTSPCIAENGRSPSAMDNIAALKARSQTDD
jgi:excisionase family DNA binding protein